jgi:hypothetical protein
MTVTKLLQSKLRADNVAFMRRVANVALHLFTVAVQD